MPVIVFVIVACALYAVGLVALLLRRHALFVLLGVFMQMGAGALLFAALGLAFGDLRGQALAFVVMGLAVPHAVVGFAVFTGLHRQQRAAHLDGARSLRG